MITMADFRQTCTQKLKEITGLRVYGSTTTDGYKRPSFFVEVIPLNFSYETKNYAKSGATFKITYFEKTHDEMECLTKYEDIRCGFGMFLNIGARNVTLKEIGYEFIGTRANMLQISIEYEWRERIPRVETEPIMKEAEIAFRKEGD